MISKKGFTLFEILIVITIMAVLSMAAFTSTANTQRQFVFINNFKELLMKIREARLYNVTQRSVDLGGGTMGIPRAYGINIKKTGKKIVTTIFADLADSQKQNQFDNSDPTIGPPFSFDSTKYTLTLINNNTELKGNKSLTLLYQPGELNVTTFYYDGNNSVIIYDPYIHLKFTDKKTGTLNKNIIIFTRSGIAEEIQDPSTLPSSTP